MKFCSSCGKQIGDAAAFCDGCGTKTTSIENTSVAVVTNEPSQMMSVKEQTDNESREQVIEQLLVCSDAILAIGVANEEVNRAEDALGIVNRNEKTLAKEVQEADEFLQQHNEEELMHVVNSFKRGGKRIMFGMGATVLGVTIYCIITDMLKVNYSLFGYVFMFIGYVVFGVIASIPVGFILALTMGKTEAFDVSKANLEKCQCAAKKVDFRQRD